MQLQFVYLFTRFIIHATTVPWSTEVEALDIEVLLSLLF